MPIADPDLPEDRTKNEAGVFTPLRHIAFARVWIASLFCNFGLLINGVGAAWEMTVLSGRPQDIALVQTALMLPYLLFALAAGAIADAYDRRTVAMVSVTCALIAASTLTVVGLTGKLNPELLLILCFALGTTNAMISPAWQSAVAEQVPPSEIGKAVALNSVSYNLARSFGPAIGGVLVAFAGSVAAFATNAVGYIPMLVALGLWRRNPPSPRLPPERVTWAILAGLKYIFHARPIRSALVQSFAVCMAGGSIMSLMPIIARDVFAGNSSTLGLLLGGFGLGAVIGALLIGRAERSLGRRNLFATSTMGIGCCLAMLAVTNTFAIALLLLFVAGICWLQVLTGFNVVIQELAPRWVIARALAAYQAATAGGLAAGSLIWGAAAQFFGVTSALGLSACALILTAATGYFFGANANETASADEIETLPDPEVVLDISGRSGPVIIELDYTVPSMRAREFYNTMMEVRRIRQKSGAYGWSIARDVANEEAWVERFCCPTWHDYLRQRNRLTQVDQKILIAAGTFEEKTEQVRVRRLLERPFGSVRPTISTPDNWPRSAGSYTQVN